MANLILPDPRMEMPELLEPGRKPVGPVEVDRSHPLARGLTEVVLFHGLRDTLTNERYQLLASGAIDAQNFIGDGGDSVFYMGTNPSHTGQISIAAGVITTATDLQHIVSADSQSNSRRDYQFRLSNQKLQFIPFVGGSTGVADGATTVPQNKHFIAGCTFDKNAATNNARVFLDGSLDGQTTKAGALDADLSGVSIGNRVTNVNYTTENIDGFGLSGLITFVFIWGDRALTAAEHLEIARNPYQFLIPA